MYLEEELLGQVSQPDGEIETKGKRPPSGQREAVRVHLRECHRPAWLAGTLEGGKVRVEQLGEKTVVFVKLVEARPLSKYMAGRATRARIGNWRTEKEK